MNDEAKLIHILKYIELKYKSEKQKSDFNQNKEIENHFEEIKSQMIKSIKEYGKWDYRTIEEDIIYNYFYDNQTLNEDYKDLNERDKGIIQDIRIYILGEDIHQYIKRYPRMAIERSLLLKTFYEYVKDNKKEYTITNKTFFRGRLFDNDDTPYKESKLTISHLPYLELVQPPFGKAGKGRFNEESQSRFYLCDSLIGVYFETNKYKLENKNKRLYIQEFKTKKDLTEIYKFYDFITGRIYCTEASDSILDKAKESIRNHYLEDDYDISNYFADIINASMYNGIEYKSAKFSQESRWLRVNDLINFNDKNIYNNFTFFSDCWNDYIEKNSLLPREYERFLEYYNFGSKIQGADYFENNGNPRELKVEEVILELFNGNIEYFDILPNATLNYNLTGILEYNYSFNFKALFKTGRMKITDFFIFKVNDEILSNSMEEGFINNYSIFKEKKPTQDYFFEFNEKTQIYFQIFKELKVYTKANRVNKIKYIEIPGNEEKISKFVFTIRYEEMPNGDSVPVIEKVEIDKEFQLVILNEFLKFFHKYFGIYYEIYFDKENEIIMIDKK